MKKLLLICVVLFLFVLSGCSAVNSLAEDLKNAFLAQLGYETTSGDEAAVARPLEVMSITVEKEPLKTVYVVGETVDLSDMSLRVKYSDGSIGIIDDGFTWTPSVMTADGKVIVEYEGETMEYFFEIYE